MPPLSRVLWPAAAAAAAAAAAIAVRRRPRDPSAPPHLHAWLPVVGSGLSVMRGPTEFQRAGHAALGPLFSAQVFKFELNFVQPGPLLTQVLAASSEEFDLVAAYRELAGKLVGEELFIDAPPESMRVLGTAALRRRTPGTIAFVRGWLGERLRGDGGEIDVLATCNALVFHSVCDYLCGSAISAARRDELAALFHTIESDYSLIGMMFPVETPSLRRRVAARVRVLEIFREEVRASLAADADEDDPMRAIVEVFVPPGEGPATAAQVEQAALAVMGLIFGAHTNTAMGLASVLLDLYGRPELLAAVRAEQAAVLGDAPLDLNALTRMTTLYRVVSESLRLRGNGGVWRKLKQPVTLGEHTLPAGALVGSMMGLINQDPQIYPEPASFCPERFGKMQTDAFACPSVSAQRPLYGAFGAGRHVCPGRALAYVMIGAIVSELVRGYELTPLRRPHLWFDLFTAGVARPLGPFTATCARTGA